MHHKLIMLFASDELNALVICALAATSLLQRALRRRTTLSQLPASGIDLSRPQSLRGKRVLVTGASQGIGRIIAIELGRLGCSVAVNYRGPADAEAARLTVLEIEAVARDEPVILGHCAVEADVGCGEDVRKMFETLDAWSAAAREADGGPTVHILVSNAGIQFWGRLLDVKEAEWDRLFATNVKGSMLCMQQAALRMADAGVGGRIIQLGGGCIRAPFPMLSGYTASKAAIEALGKVGAVELGPHRITVNTVAPGAIETERTRKETADFGAAWGPLTPLRRIGQPRDAT